MGYVTIDEIALSWGISTRQVRSYCASGRVAGAKFEHGAWLIPEDAEKPNRKTRARLAKFRSVWAVLDAERKSKLSGGIYHQLQIDFTYNSNHMEGSRLTHEQTRWIFETKTIGKINAEIPVDDIIETANHFSAVDTVIASARSMLTESYIKRLHAILKSGTADSGKEWFAVGDYKRLENTVGGLDTTPPDKVEAEMKKLLAWYRKTEHSFEDITEFHVRFERIHPFQDGNGRIGRLIMLKECLKYGITPILVLDRMRQYYYLGLQEWQKNDKQRARLLDTFRAGQDLFIEMLRHFGHDLTI